MTSTTPRVALISAVCAAAALALSACATNGASSPGSSSAAPEASSTAEAPAFPSADPRAAEVLPQVEGKWGVEGGPLLDFRTEGVSGSDGCNSLRGFFRPADNGQIEVYGVAQTRMACQGVDDWLSKVQFVQVDGESLQVFNEEHEKIGSLERAK